jgi:hypothetical protein
MRRIRQEWDDLDPSTMSIQEYTAELHTATARPARQLTPEELQTTIDRMGTLLYGCDKESARRGIPVPGNNQFNPS